MACVLFLVPLTQPASGQTLDDLTQEIKGRRMRASSGLFDPESNIDAWPIDPGATATIADLEGPGEIQHIWFTIGALDRRFTRSLVLRIYWDGAPDPSVESPIGDFFAAGHGMRANVGSWPIEVTSYGRAFNSYWRMPFRKRVRITLTNESTQRVNACYFYVDWLKLVSPPPATMMYFHARYRQEFPVKPFSPYVIADIKGKGHYVGTVLSIHSSTGSWVGEADDRFYIDGEKEPSLVGTGTEDYFTDAWNLRLFTNPRAGVTIYEPKGPDQRATMYRWHIADPITFAKSLRVENERRSFVQLLDPATGQEETWDFKYRPDFYSSVAYWYASEPAPRFWEFPPVGERLNPEIFIETTLMIDRLKASPGATVTQKGTRSTNAASGDARRRMTYLQNDRVGGWLDVPVEVTESGDYSVSIYQLLYHDFGIYRVTMTGPGFERVMHPDMDFYDAYAAQTFNMPENHLYGTWRENQVGIYTLEPGRYTIRFECIGANPLSRAQGVTYTGGGGHRQLRFDQVGKAGYHLGLDGISLRKLPWQDMWTWTQDYLKREERLFAEWIATARATVQQLAAAIERFKADVGEYPRSLDELVKRPARLAGKPGRWPYVPGDGVPNDPWGQQYRYRQPGVHNPQGFDVHSVHGNERDPKVWIGNWAK
jgi:hypothetical protein